MDKSSLQEIRASPSFLLKLGDAGDPRAVQQGAQLTPEPPRGLACLGPALLSHSPALLWLQTRKTGLGNLTGKTQGANSPSPHCSAVLTAPAKAEGGEIRSPGVPSPRPAPRVCPPAQFSCSHREGSQEEHSVPEISRQFSSSNLQASVRVRKRQPMGFRGWPTQPSKLVMVVAPRCSSSAKNRTERH